jgi:hypothetical protein
LKDVFEITMLHILYKLLLISSLLLLLLLRNSESLQFPTSSRRTFFIKAAAAAATSTSVIATTLTAASYDCEVANAAIDVSGLRAEQQQKQATVTVTPGRAPNQPKSGPLAGTKLGFQVDNGPRSEEQVRKIDEPRYAAVRKAQGLGPLFLEGVPIEQ